MDNLCEKFNNIVIDKPLREEILLDLFFRERLTQLFNSGMERSAIQETLAQEFDIPKDIVRKRVGRFYQSQKPKTFSPEVVTKDMEYKQDGSVIFNRIIKLADDNELTPKDMLIAHGMNPDKWDVISYKNNLWQSQKQGGKLLNLYQSKITVRPKLEEITLEKIQEHFDKMKAWKPTFQPKYEKTNAKYLYEINLADIHLGKFSYNEETGEYLDSSITQRRFYEIIKQECEKIQPIKDRIEKILFVWTNDFFNSDGISGSTTGGTPQDTDMKWQQLYMTGVDMLVAAITQLAKYAPVKTFYIASNHSRQTDFYAINYLYAWFRDFAHVEVDRNPHPRYYEEYGVNLIGYAHSYYEKKENLPYLMSIERPREFGRTKYREYHLAHYHCEKVEEKGGIIFRWLPSITGTDSWSNDCGYIGAVKRSYSFVYDKDKGLVQMNCTVVD